MRQLAFDFEAKLFITIGGEWADDFFYYDYGCGIVSIPRRAFKHLHEAYKENELEPGVKSNYELFLQKNREQNEPLIGTSQRFADQVKMLKKGRVAHAHPKLDQEKLEKMVTSREQKTLLNLIFS